MKKIVRNLATPETRAFWETAQQAFAEVETWPSWRRAGINVSQLRHEARHVSTTAKAQKARKPVTA